MKLTDEPPQALGHSRLIAHGDSSELNFPYFRALTLVVDGHPIPVFGKPFRLCLSGIKAPAKGSVPLSPVPLTPWPR